MDGLVRPNVHRRLPVVLSTDEVSAILGHLSGAHGVLAQLLYGTGMRLTEGLRLRVKDIDFDRLTLVVREGKGGKDRAVMLPQTLMPSLKEQLAHSRELWALDRAQQRNGVEMPQALEKKYPKAGMSWGWHWVFPQDQLSVDPRSGIERRHHLYDQTFQRAFKRGTSSRHRETGDVS